MSEMLTNLSQKYRLVFFLIFLKNFKIFLKISFTVFTKFTQNLTKVSLKVSKNFLKFFRKFRQTDKLPTSTPRN